MSQSVEGVHPAEMREWFEDLRPGQRVLDVGSGTGSFPGLERRCTVIALDEDVDAFCYAAPPGPGLDRVFSHSHRMPFAPGSMDGVICHHSLEHIAQLEETLDEVARVLAPSGRLYVSVPNGYGLCDSIYRWVYEGGGHVNRFRRQGLVETVEGRVGVKLVCWQKLYSSFAHLWRLAEMMQDPPPGLAPRLRRIGRLPFRAITGTQHLLYSGTRMADRWLGTDLALYGWAFWFDRAGGPGDERPAFLNVCRACGTGQPAEGLEHPAPGKFRCVNCGRGNPFFRPFGNTL
jgi:SAM-dependent methyltransferase